MFSSQENLDDSDDRKIQFTPHIENLTFITQLNIGEPHKTASTKIQSETLFIKQKPQHIVNFSQQMTMFRFLNKLRQRSGNVCIDQIKVQHLKILNDLAADHSQHEYKGQTINRLIIHNKKKVTKEQIDWNQKLYKRYINKIPIIVPNSSFSLILDFVVILSTLMQLLFIPIMIAFTLESNNLIMKCQSYIYFILTVDILRQLLTGVFIEGVLILDRFMIIQKYIQEEFIIDIVTVLMYWIYDSIVLKIFFLIRITKINKILNRLEMALALDKYNLMQILKLLFIMIFTTQLMSCLQYLLEKATTGFYQHNFSQTQSVFQQYVTSLYWAVATMVSVGYGDILPVQNEQKLYTIGVMILGCCLFGYMLNSIGNMLQMINENQKQHSQYIVKHDAYFQDKPISSDLLSKVRQYAEHYYQFQKSNISSGQDFLKSVSKELHSEYKEQVNGRIVEQSKLFQKFTPKARKIIIDLMQEQIYLPTDLIAENSNNLYILQQGCVDWFFGQALIEKYDQVQQYINVIPFFTDLPQRSRLYSQQLTILFVLDRQLFLQMLKDQILDFQTFHYLKEELIYNKNYKLVNSSCPICGMLGHIITGCPKVHFIPSRDRILHEHRNIDQTRKYLQRQRMCKSRSRKDIQSIQASTLLYIEDNYDMLQRNNQVLKITSIDEDFDSENLLVPKSQLESRLRHSQIEPQISVIYQSDFDNQIIRTTPYKPSQLSMKNNTMTKIDLDMEFEKMTDYSNYYPEFNASQIISRIKAYRRRDQSGSLITSIKLKKGDLDNGDKLFNKEEFKRTFRTRLIKLVTVILINLLFMRRIWI
ncbi:hypothetical protein pb186bvf_002895 [Paramecium bursaria]